MKLEALSILDQRNTMTSSKFYNGVMVINFHVIIVFLICSHSVSTRQTDSKGMVHIWKFVIKIDLLSNKKQKPELKHLTQISYYLCYLRKKSFFFAKKKEKSAKRYWCRQNWGSLGTLKFIFWNYIYVCICIGSFKFLLLSYQVLYRVLCPHHHLKTNLWKALPDQD